MVRVPTHREPSHAGEMLLEAFLRPMNLSQRDLAEAIHVPYQSVNELVNRQTGHYIRYSERSGVFENQVWQISTGLLTSE